MKRFICAALWLLVLCAGIAGLDRVMRRSEGAKKYDAFFADKQGFDVFLMGTSHMIDTVFANELWRDYGITSYNLGNPAETLEATYWTLRLALEYHTPEAVLVDIFYVDRAQKDNNYAYGHLFLDELPLSRLKLEAIRALYPKEEWTQFIFPFSYTHARWEEILAGTGEPTVEPVEFMFGSEFRAARSEPAPFVRTQEMDLTQVPGKQALRSIIELCQEKGIEVALIAIPFPAMEQPQKMMNSVQVIADEYGVPYLNLFETEGLVDFNTDCYDAGSHLNPDGARKVSAYVGAWMDENWALEDHRGDPAYRHWDEALVLYEQLWDEKWAHQSLLE